ncbi:MAG: YggT family protein [Anaerolineae bacterium]
MLLVVRIIDLIFNIFYFLILARIIFSFIRVSPYHPTWGPILRFVYDTTEPVLAPFRRILPPMGGLDFSPMIALIVASFVRQILIQLVLS